MPSTSSSPTVYRRLALLARTLLTPQEHIAVESPCYPGAWNLFTSFAPQIHAIPVDECGLRTELLPEQQCALAYVTPSHQYPVGSTLPLTRRLACSTGRAARMPM